MPFVKRDADAKVISVSLSRENEGQDYVASDDTDLAAFFNEAAASVDSLRESDMSLVRVLEDLIEMLTTKGVILFTELPESAQEKILQRQRLRTKLSEALDLLDTD